MRPRTADSLAAVPWDPTGYLSFGGPRTRPAIDLLDRVPSVEPDLVYDLGCGPGNSTVLLTERWPSGHRGGCGPFRCDARRGSPPGTGCVRSCSATWRRGNRTARGMWCSATPPCNGSTTTSGSSPGSSPGRRLAACWRCRCHATTDSPSHLAVGEVAILAALGRRRSMVSCVTDPVAEPAVYLDLIGAVGRFDRSVGDRVLPRARRRRPGAPMAAGDAPRAAPRRPRTGPPRRVSRRSG